MNGLNKQQLSFEQINEALHHICGCRAATIVELSDGWANSVYELQLDAGSSWIMKVSPPASTTLMRYEYELMKTEVAAMELLQQAGQIPVPKVIAFDRSRSLLDGEIVIMEKLQGEPYIKLKEALTMEERSGIERQLGHYTALLHAIKAPSFGPFCAPHDYNTSWRDVFLIMINSVLDDGEDAHMPLPLPYQELRDLLYSNTVCMNEVTVPSLIHWDLWDGNILVHEGKITGIIDFERALWGDPLFEHYFSNTALDNASFVQGYGNYEQLTDNEQLRIACYKLYMDLIMYIECHYRGYMNEGHVAWAKSAMEQGVAVFLQKISNKQLSGQ